jgi:DNA-binding transcriptional LysR family regulator
VWREPLVWAAADTFDLVPGAALPLALYRERSVSREAALAALQGSELTWEIVYTSPSLTGVRAAALAGLAIIRLCRPRRGQRPFRCQCDEGIVLAAMASDAGQQIPCTGTATMSGGSPIVARR